MVLVGDFVNGTGFDVVVPGGVVVVREVATTGGGDFCALAFEHPPTSSDTATAAGKA